MLPQACRRSFIAALAVLIASGFLARPAPAQWPEPTMQVRIPYPFVLGSRSLPPDTYSIATTSDRDVILVQQMRAQPIVVLVAAHIARSSSFLGQGSIVFDNNGARRAIAELWLPGAGGLLLHTIPATDVRDVLLGNFLQPAASASGKQVYAITCARCHGADGHGDPDADAFFHTSIPRLASPAIRRQADAQARAFLNPSATDSQAAFRHQVPPQDVDSLIAYVRSLR